MRVTVIGAGNGGHAISGSLALNGHTVTLYDRFKEKLETIISNDGIQLKGQINGFGKLHKVTTDLSDAILGAEIIMIVTIANAHSELAKKMTSFLEDGQIIVLNPGRTCGAIEFHQVLKLNGLQKHVFIAETQSLIFACRIIEQGTVNIIGTKDKVMLSALPSSDTPYVLSKLGNLYPCFLPSKNVLETSLENYGAIFHPCVILFNAATIERGNKFYFYRDMTDRIASFIEKFDAERISVGKSYGIDLISAKEWISYAYNGVEGESLLEKMRNNPAYFDIYAPGSIESRQLMEDIPTGVIPILNLGEIAGIDMPLFKSVVAICSALLNKDFYSEGRTLDKFGIRCVGDVLKILS